MAIWEGLTPDEVPYLSEGSELLLVPNGTGGKGTMGALQYAIPKKLIYTKQTNLNFKQFFYLTQVE